MEPHQSFVLALIQGITEFLPISSSAHLILVPSLLGWEDQGLAFDVAVHVGTLFAVLAFLRRELAVVIPAWLAGWKQFSWSPEGLLGWLIILSTIPVGLVGFAFDDFIEGSLRTPSVIAAATAFFALLLWWSDHGADRNQKQLNSLTWKSATLVGLAQAFALIPGTSRSGVTMTALLALGYHRVAAAKYSFLLAVPTIALPGLLKANDLASSQTNVDWLALCIGVVVSALVAFVCMRWFIAVVTKLGMMPFVIYRLVLAAGLLWVFSS